ncbi:hypothetical protein [Streptomyces sp. NBC_01760]|uniref:hypothetical protein n=1 Tax=Streptomyces sp. NBC_01760 TaxID=2975931 RepID=UPI002DDA8261|nr:hypothetical protein [Streptomyces sp. NBC_01760]WSC72224.1 hypothetical protein OG807_29160 [Streptomyces sp. NBC_01760]
MTEYTMDGVWDDGSGLNVEYLGTDLSEATIEGVVAGNRDNNAFTHTVEADSEAEAFRFLGEELDADSVWDCQDGERRLMYRRQDEDD